MPILLLASRNMGENTCRKLFFGFIACTCLVFLRQALVALR